MQSLFRPALGVGRLQLLAALVAALVATSFFSQAYGQTWHNADNPLDVSGDNSLGIDDFHAIFSEFRVSTLSLIHI